jgi:hypothetical protein
MSVKVRRRVYFVVFSSLLGLVVWGVVAVAGAESLSCDPLDDDSPENVFVLDLALPSLPPSRALPRERVERVSPEPPFRLNCPSLHFSISCGVPAETGKDLLTYLEISRT